MSKRAQKLQALEPGPEAAQQIYAHCSECQEVFFWGRVLWRPGDSFIYLRQVSCSEEVLELHVSGPYEQGDSVIQVFQPRKMRVGPKRLEVGRAGSIRWGESQYSPQPPPEVLALLLT